MQNFTNSNFRFLHAGNRKPSLNIKLLTKVILFFMILSSGTAIAQTVSNHNLTCVIPPGGKDPCTSNDLQIVGVSIVAPACTSCTPGQTVTYPLKMTIHNGTNSERTSFALYGTLSSGATINGKSGPIFVCVGPITVKSNQTLAGETAAGNQTFAVGTITFTCGQNLTLTNNYLAWTDAAGNTAARCDEFSKATKCADIAPKCGQAASITISGPVVPPTLGGIDPTCTTNTGSITLTPVTGFTYSFDGGTYGAYPSGGWTGLAAGSTHTVSATRPDGCISPNASRTIGGALTVPATPTITSAPATCSAAGSSTISNYSASNTYTFTPAGPSVGTGGLISGMTVGTSYTVTSNNGSCTSAASAPFSNAAKLVTPATPTISSVAPTCSAAGSSTISNYSASNTYAFTPAGPSVGTGGLISGMTVGTSYTVTANNGSCTSPASAPFSNAAMLVTPATPTISSVAPTCSAAGSSTISNYSASNTYAFTPAGPSVGAGGLVSGMTVGTSYTVTANNGSCTSPASAPFSNAAMLVTPATPTITSVPPTCSAAGSSTISNYSASNTYAFTPSGPSVGTGGLISGMTVGTSYTVTANNGSCTSPASAPFSNAANLASPTFKVCVVQPTLCTLGSLTINATGGSGFLYTIDGTNPTAGNTNNVFNNLNVGSVITIKVKNSDGCSATPVNCADIVSDCSAPMMKSQSAPITQAQTTTTVKAYPNPFGDRVRFVVTSSQSGSGALELYNMTGQKLNTIYRGRFEKGIARTFEYSVPGTQRGNLIYLLKVGTEKLSGRLIGLK